MILTSTAKCPLTQRRLPSSFRWGKTRWILDEATSTPRLGIINGLIASHTQSSEHGLHRAKIPTSVQMYLEFCIVVCYPDEPSFMGVVCLYGSEIEAGEWTVLLELSRWRNSYTVRLAR